MKHRLELAADYEAARQIGPWLSTTIADLQADLLDRVGELELALHELAINIVDHAYDDDSRPTGTYSIELTRDGDAVCARFVDQGAPFVDGRPPATDEPTVGGYGLMIAEQLASSISYERVGTENHWTVIFDPPPSTLESP